MSAQTDAVDELITLWQTSRLGKWCSEAALVGLEIVLAKGWQNTLQSMSRLITQLYWWA